MSSQEQPQEDEPTTYFPPAPQPEYIYDAQWQQGYPQGYVDPHGYVDPQGYVDAGYDVPGAFPAAEQNFEQGFEEAPQRSNGMLVFLGVLVFGLAIFSSAAALYIFGNRPGTEHVAEISGQERQGEGREVDSPAEDFGQRIEDLGRPTVAKLPPEAQPVNVAAKQNHPAGNLFNVYKSGPASDEFAIETQYEYVSLYSEPPTGDHLLLVFDDAADDFAELHCRDFSSYVRCVAPGNRYIYIA